MHGPVKHGPPSSEQILVVLGITLLLGTAQGCLPGNFQRPGSQERELPGSLLGMHFERLWSRNTVVLNAQRPRSRPIFSQSGEGFAGQLFPLTVRATIMDSVLIETGVQEFARLAGMDSVRTRQYRDCYHQRHRLDEHVFLCVEVATVFPEEFLDADRWTFFFEDEKLNQVEPAVIVQHPIRKEPPLGERADSWSSQSLTRTQRVIELYFVRSRLLRNPRDLKLVVVEFKNSNVRAEGTWEPMPL